MSVASSSAAILEPTTEIGSERIIDISLHTNSGLRFASGMQQSFVEDRFTLRSGQVVAAELNYRLYHNEQGNPWEKEIVIVHSALTGSAKAFTKGPATQGDGWANMMSDLPKFNLDKYTVLVAEPLAGNAQGLSKEHCCSGRDFHFKYPEVQTTSYDAVALISKLLQSKGLDEVHNISCFSMGGINLPAWLAQDAIKVREIDNHFSNYQLTPETRAYWKIQLDLLTVGAEAPNFAKISERLAKNFGFELESLGDFVINSPFNACIYSLAGRVQQLQKVYESSDTAEYLNEALKVVRGISFLRFQTRENYDCRKTGSCLDFLESQGDSFPARMDPYNYASLLRQMLDKSFDTPKQLQALKEAKEDRPVITYIMSGNELLFPRPFNCPEATRLADQTVVLKTEDWGHDFFLSPQYSSTLRSFMRK